MRPIYTDATPGWKKIRYKGKGISQMVHRKSFTVVTISTILFGVLSKWLVGIPYMSLNHFDLYFVMSFILWVLYAASLYIASKIKCNGTSPIAFWKSDDAIFI